MEKLSSGFRINRAGDDAAGLAISEKMRGQIRGLDQASRNAQDGISMIQTAEGALNETHSILQRMRELAVQSANDTNVNVDRSEIQKEIDELAKEITRIANSTEFNTQKLINGAKTTENNGSIKFHVGANTAQDITLSLNAMDAKTLGVSRDKVTSATGTAAATANTAIDSATFAGELGAGIVDGAVVTFAYTAGQAGNAGSPSILTATNIFTSASLAGLDDGNNAIVFTVGSDAYTLDETALKGWTNGAGFSTLNDAVDFLGNANNVSGDKLSDVATISHDGEKLTITLKDKGDTTLGVAINGTSANVVAGVFGFGVSQNGISGAAVEPAESAKITLTSDKGHVQTVAVADPTATSLSINTGNFQGMTITLGAGKTLADVHAEDKVTLAAASAVAAAAQFGSDGSLIDEAVTEAGIDVSSQSSASSAITTIQNAIEMVSAERSKLGAYQNRLEHTINNLGTSAENLTAAESRIRDVDMAKEMMEFTKNNILTQAAQAMLAQANTQPQGVLQLLR